MQRKSLLLLLITAALASIVVSGLAIPSTTYTWEKTFEVKKPEIECEIEIGDCRIVGYPVNIWVKLKLEECGDCCRRDDYDDNDYDWKDCRDSVRCHLNGTYAAHLYWWNETSQEYQHIISLEQGKNITLTCENHRETHTFIPMWEGRYKVVVTFTTSEGTNTFGSDD